jgi:hypothetical protein
MAAGGPAKVMDDTVTRRPFVLQTVSTSRAHFSFGKTSPSLGLCKPGIVELSEWSGAI